MLASQAGCGKEDVVGTSAPPKAVSVITLKTSLPRSETLVAGVVEPYRRSDVSFDVPGLLTEVIDLGEAADGPQFDGTGELLLHSNGTPVRAGTILALLDPTRYQQAVEAAKLSLASTDREIDAMIVELEEVFPARIDSSQATVEAATADVTSARQSVAAAQAELELALTTVKRDRTLIESGAIAQSVLDESESSFQTASASLAQTQAALDAALQNERSAKAGLSETQGDSRVRQADLASLRASRAEQLNSLDQAETDLASCILRAPFQGRVTKRHVERGSYANAGTAVVELTMETAVKVVITVSAEEERRFALGTRLPVYAETSVTSGEPVQFMGTVFEKASIADTGTRTFRIGLILPNPFMAEGDLAQPGGLASISDFFPVLSLPGTAPDAMFVNVASVLTKDGAAHVLALPRTVETKTTTGEILIPRPIPIEFTDEWEQFDKWTLRRIRPNRDLRPGDGLVLNPKPADEAGVRIGSLQYAFRSGDVVRVGTDAALPNEGHWITSTAIVPRTGDNLVFVIEEGKAKEIVVDVLETSGSFRQISSPELSDGMAIVVRGMQYLADGDPVSTESVNSGEDQ
ncbi:MAG: efflux RND transporter periplasmic adaptor subunit [Planctomycetota bacterium]